MHRTMNLFSTAELARYQRHLGLTGFGPAAQEKLKQGSVLVIGAGGLGCPALLYLAAAGVGRIEIVDDDRVDVSNLQRQVLYTEADAGAEKTDAAVRRLNALNPHIEIIGHTARFTRDNALGLVRGVDVVVDGSDNFATRYLVNDACVLTNRPLVYGAIQAFEGQLSVFNFRGGPTYRCLFPEPPEPGSVPNCAEAGVLGVLPGLIGTAQACEAIKLLTGIGEPLSGRLLLWDALTMRTQTLALALDPRSRQITALPPEGYGETCAISLPAGEEIEVTALRELLDSTGAAAVQVLDVREGWERDLGAILPSTHVPLGEIERAPSAQIFGALDPKQPTVVYCAGGTRSLRAAQILRTNHGFASVTSLRGGFRQWQQR
jgi:sulfur-carrier protein adenylyltransferase/sulfurtransferase